MKYFASLFLVFFVTTFVFATENQPSQAGYLVHLLNYLGNDYKSAIENGKVKSEDEYAEMKEFAESIVKNAQKISLEESAKNEVTTKSANILSLVLQKKAPIEVKKACDEVRSLLIKMAGIATSPLSYPSLSKGKIIFSTNCAKCHGEKGYGDGPEGKELDPSPRNFHDSERMLTLSAFNVYNTVRYGIDGTGMKSHPELSDAEVWDAAFYLLSLRSTAADTIYSPSLSLAQISTLTNLEIDEKLGKDKHLAVRLWQPTQSGFSFTKSLEYLTEAKTILLKGDLEGVEKLLTIAYLECIEPNEEIIKKRDENTITLIERKISETKAALKARNSADAMQHLKELEAMLQSTNELITKSEIKPWVSFFMTISVLLREGLEALLIVIIFMSVLSATGAERAKKVVHLGWLSAIVVGSSLWFLIGELLRSQKWNMELLEGSITLVAVGLMVYVGLWLHRKSSIDKWKEYIQSKITHNGIQNGLWSVFSLSFLVVFREIFESILLVSSIDIQSKGEYTNYILAACGVSLLVVVILYIVMTQLSKKLPFKQLISFSIVMLCILAVMLTGKAIHSFQEAGVLAQSFLPLPTIDVIGFFATWQTIIPQLVLIVGLTWLFKKIKNA